MHSGKVQGEVAQLTLQILLGNVRRLRLGSYTLTLINGVGVGVSVAVGVGVLVAPGGGVFVGPPPVDGVLVGTDVHVLCWVSLQMSAVLDC